MQAPYDTGSWVFLFYVSRHRATLTFCPVFLVQAVLCIAFDRHLVHYHGPAVLEYYRFD
jgi:hypothetical protein